MALDIHNLIAAINPDIYCDSEKKKEVKETKKEKGIREAAKKAKPLKSEFMNFDDIAYENPFKKPGHGNPIEKHKLTYDASSESLEAIYFWVIDTINKELDDIRDVHKLVDNFVSSPGSSHFSEFGMKATTMQNQGLKLLGDANNVLKSILNIVYDLKEFRLRLGLYDTYKDAKSKAEKNAALLSLKQVWMDTVDAKRGNTGLKMMAQQYDYVTLIDAFMSAESADDVAKPSDKGGLDLNERVRRIVQQRVYEFFLWVKESDKELRKRYEIEKTYLKSQVNAVKLYAHWAKPYLKAARALEQRMSPDANIVTVFNTAMFELLIVAEGEYKVGDEIIRGNLPKIFSNKNIRQPRTIVVVQFRFRSIPERAGQQGYGYRGKVEIEFTSYSLNDEEIDILKKEVDKDDLDDTFALIEGATSESLSQIQEEINEFLEEDNKKEKKEEKKDLGNPFSALVEAWKDLFGKKKKEEEKKDKKGEIKPDSDLEAVLRSQVIIKARKECRKIYGLYKSAHNMPTF
ncbi:hypothetical protein FJZ18_00590 [Candidatus Pacearchaeota archaeon]|nr:hypothetical protein [Candidatus Pacearchaeota archaeon]